MPKLITFSTGNTIEIVYDAAGNKLRKIVKAGATVQYEQDYSGGIEYRKTPAAGTFRIEAIYHEEGRYFNLNVDASNTPAWRKEYALRDHLGSTRLLFADKDGDGMVEVTNNPATNEILQENHYYPFGLSYGGSHWMNDAARDNGYKYNGKELNEDWGLGWYDYGARWYDAALGRFTGVDPLANNYPSISTYAYVANNPLNMIDPDGRYIVPASFAQKYKMITSYLQKHIANDVMNSPTILNAFASNTAADSPEGVGNLSVNKVRETVTWDSGPSIVAKDNPGGMSGANGYYDSINGEIQLSTARLDHLEAILGSDASDEDKFKALLPVYMTLLHETVHYGDYLDGLRQDGGEPGNEFESDVWMNKRVEANGETFAVFYFFGDKYNPNDVQEIIDEKKGQNVFPTVPKNEKK